MKDDFRVWGRMVVDDAEVMITAARTVAGEWAVREIEQGNWDEYSMKRFLDLHPEWNYDHLIDAIEAEMGRVVHANKDRANAG